jgi:hypothetical protein
MLSLNVEACEEVRWTTKERRMELGGTKGRYSRRRDKITGEGKQDKQEN